MSVAETLVLLGPGGISSGASWGTTFRATLRKASVHAGLSSQRFEVTWIKEKAYREDRNQESQIRKSYLK